MNKNKNKNKMKTKNMNKNKNNSRNKNKSKNTNRNRNRNKNKSKQNKNKSNSKNENKKASPQHLKSTDTSLPSTALSIWNRNSRKVSGNCGILPSEFRFLFAILQVAVLNDFKKRTRREREGNEK